MPPVGMVLGQVSIATSSCLVTPWPTHPAQSHLSLPLWVILSSMDHPVFPWLQSGLWHPGLALHGLFSNLAAPCPAGSCCWLSSCLHLEQHMATHPWASSGGSEWHRPSCDPLVNVAASRARALGEPGCGSCVTGEQQPAGGGGSSTSPGLSWLCSVCPVLLPAPTSGSEVTPAPSATHWGWPLPDKASRPASTG